MPNTPEHRMGSPSPAHRGKSIEPGKGSIGGGAGQSGHTPPHQKPQLEVSHHLKKRGAATPNSMMLLHRKGYIIDNSHTLGTGAYAKVKVGTSLKMNIQVAIKIVNKLSAPKEVVERFLPREIETMRAVNNDHIIKLYEVIESPETLFFVMELADRGDLLDFINERKYLSERLAKGFFSDLVKGIDHCHSRGVVHRDLKCENLLLDAHMRLKISDFGFARKFDGNLKTFCGSFAYAAPEVILGNPYNGPLADIWSMGIILYAMVTGRLPFKDTSTSVLMADIAAGPKFSSRHTDRVKSLIQSILTYLPHERANMVYIQGHPWMDTQPRKSVTSIGGDLLQRNSKSGSINKGDSSSKQHGIDVTDVWSNTAKTDSKSRRGSIFSRGKSLLKGKNSPKAKVSPPPSVHSGEDMKALIFPPKQATPRRHTIADGLRIFNVPGSKPK